MSAMEGLLRTVLNASGIDIEEVKREVTTRIAAFEKNVETLNNTLILHHAKLDRIEQNMVALFAHLGIPYIKGDAALEPHYLTVEQQAMAANAENNRNTVTPQSGVQNNSAPLDHAP